MDNFGEEQPQLVRCPLCKQIVMVGGPVYCEDGPHDMDGWLRLSCGDIVDGVEI